MLNSFPARPDTAALTQQRKMILTVVFDATDVKLTEENFKQLAGIRAYGEGYLEVGQTFIQK
jgi:hypothetical protein